MNVQQFLDNIKVNKSYLGKSDMTSGNKYKIIIKYNNNQCAMTFHDNYYNESSKNDILFAFIMDVECVQDCNFKEFCQCFGYDYFDKKAKNVYNACLRQVKKFNRLFNAEEQKTLFEYFDKY